MNEYASSGTYYFASGSLMLDAFHETIKQGLDVDGEFYVSMAYKPLLAAGKTISVYPLQHFMQWGTPDDLSEYRMWSSAFRSLMRDTPPQKKMGATIIPMAGLGKRFSDEGYAQTKPLIPVSGHPMVLQATADLPASNVHVFVMRKDMPEQENVASQIANAHQDAVIKCIDRLTEGQACTALIGLETLGAGYEEPITIGACDNGALYDSAAFAHLLHDDSVDVIVWGIRGYANAARHPAMYGWIDSKDGTIASVSVKAPLNDPKSDPIVVGTFTFRRAEDFEKAVGRLVARDGRVNGEFYIDSCINDAIALGLNCRLFEIDSFLCWGTPNDLKTFEYWQSCFHKWNSHPYRLEHDKRVAPDAVKMLQERYKAWTPAIPEHLS